MSESYALDRQLLFVNEYTHSCQYEFEKMKESAHSKFNMDVFITDTSRVEDINCYFYAISITYLPNRSLQRIGAISGKKAMSLCYTMADDLSELFKADMETLELNVTEVKTGLNPTKYGLISQIEGMHLGSNQYIVLLYKQVYPHDHLIFRDFHFVRYDKENGFTQKRKWQRASKLDTRYFWLSDDYILNGCYIITQ